MIEIQTPPPPLVPLEVDLREFAFLPLDAVRLRDSSLAVESSGDEFRAAVLLWCVAWHQVPAASLPNDDRSLAMYAGFGRDLKGWSKVRKGALRGFTVCADGRIYHTVLAEKANEAWEGRLQYRHRRECDRIKKASQRAKLDAVYPSFEVWKLHVSETGGDKWEPEAGDVPQMSLGTNEGRPANVAEHVQRPSPAIRERERDSGEGQGTVESSKSIQSSLRSDSSTAAPSSRTTPKDIVNDQRAQRIAQITDDAVEEFNNLLGKPHGALPAVAAGVGMAKRRNQVTRCLRVARDICKRLYGSTIITREFWAAYFAEVDSDDFKAGRRQGSKDHQTWTPSFEYLTREQTMLDVFDRSEASTVDVAAVAA